MQRPRRTSEFQEEPGTCGKRQSRQRQTCGGPSPAAPGTAQKYITRQSRIARPSSTDRQLLNTVSTSALRSRTTPQKFIATPCNAVAPRVLFTAEKQRNASGIPLHNDKKWVQEQMQRIVDHLREAAAPGAIVGINSDFFNRSSCLRQMSIKQFVAIINYFLQFVGRYSVGTNYIEDIVSVLDKLRYPHQVNKSWLKTPNTQHSFGNVIVLLDFLMDFVPSRTAAQTEPMLIPLQDPAEAMTNSLREEPVLQVPDVEFQSQMLRNTEEGFTLWDKQLMQEFKSLQQKTCDTLIQKRCGIQGLDQLNAELQKLKKKLGELQKNRPNIRKEDEKKHSQLEADIKSIQQQSEAGHEELESNAQALRQMLSKEEAFTNAIKQLQQEIAQLQTTIQAQKLTVEQRSKLIEEAAQLKYMLQSQERTLRDLEERNNRQMVQLSRTKKHLTDWIEKFNAHMREIAYSQLHPNAEELQLPLQPERENVDASLKALQSLREQVKEIVESKKLAQKEGEQRVNAITHEIATRIELKSNSLHTALNSIQNHMQGFEKQDELERSALDNKLLELEEQVLKVQAELLSSQQSHAQRQAQLQRKQQENEQTMSEAEREYHACTDTREELLSRLANALEDASGDLLQLTDIVKQNERLAAGGKGNAIA